MRSMLNTETPTPYLLSFAGLAATIFTPETVQIFAGLSTVALSISGIVVNCIKFYNQYKNPNKPNT